jgi:hypothetical protein
MASYEPSAERRRCAGLPRGHGGATSCILRHDPRATRQAACDRSPTGMLAIHGDRWRSMTHWPSAPADSWRVGQQWPEGRFVRDRFWPLLTAPGTGDQANSIGPLRSPVRGLRSLFLLFAVHRAALGGTGMHSAALSCTSRSTCRMAILARYDRCQICSCKGFATFSRVDTISGGLTPNPTSLAFLVRFG